MDKGEDSIVERDLARLVERMNALTGEPLLNLKQVEHEIAARDLQLDNPFCKDAQITAIRATRRYLGDRLIRTARPHKLLGPSAGPLIAVRLRILTRKTLGGLQTDLDSRVIGADGQPVPGCTPPARWRVSAAAVFMATLRSRERFLAAAFFRAAPPAAPRRMPSAE